MFRIRNQLLIILAAAILTPAAHAETLAKAHGGTWDVSIETSGDMSPDCRLNLAAASHLGRHQISLKRRSSALPCLFFGPVTLLTSESSDYKLTHVFVEGSRGGDADHTGPMVGIYALDEDALRKLGEQELFDAVYQRKNGEIVSVSGNVLFNFCDVCDGPEASEDEDKIFVPAVLTFGCGGICVMPNVSEKERASLIAKFNAQKAALAAEVSSGIDKAHTVNLEKRFHEFLNRKQK